ncbi:unnamed protein product [Scytosiphon promiscuus]
MWTQGALSRVYRPVLTMRGTPGVGLRASQELAGSAVSASRHRILRLRTKLPPPPAANGASISTIDGRAKVQLPRNLSPLWNKKREISIFGRHICWVSLSDAAGHLSFVFLGMGFLETELLPLRVYAAAGVSASIAFQYYRPQPLWIPISWNTIFLIINVSMVGLLLKEERDAERQDQESATLYDQTFRESGLTAVDFMKIANISEDTSRSAEGQVLAEEHVTQDKLYLVVEGELQVSKGGSDIATVRPGEFAGEMSFLRHIRRECEETSERKGVCDCAAVANVAVKTDEARLKSWDFDELRHLLAHNPNMSVRFHAALARAMASKLVDTHNPAVRYRQLLTGVLVDGVVTATEKDELAKMRREMKVDEATHEEELRAAGWSTQEFEQGYHDELSSRTYEALARDVLRHGTVNEKGRAILRMHRQKNGIDALRHIRVLRKLGWNLDQFEEGTIVGRPSLSKTPPDVSTG